MNFKLGSVLPLAALALAACTTPSAENASGQAAQTMQNAGDAVRQGANAAANNAAAAGSAATNAVGTAAGNVRNAVSADAETAKIKAALLAAQGLDASHITVTTTEKQIFLRGSVPTDAQKTQAEEAAKNTAGVDYEVVDQLTAPAGH